MTHDFGVHKWNKDTKDYQVVITPQQFILLFFFLFIFVGGVLSLSHSIFLLHLHAPNIPTKLYVQLRASFLFLSVFSSGFQKLLISQRMSSFSVIPLCCNSTRGTESKKCDLKAELVTRQGMMHSHNIQVIGIAESEQSTRCLSQCYLISNHTM